MLKFISIVGIDSSSEFDYFSISMGLEIDYNIKRYLDEGSVTGNCAFNYKKRPGIYHQLHV